MSRERWRLLAAVGLQLLILALVPARQVLAGARGQEVTLATAPVDPYDIFSGAYVRLAYEVEQTSSVVPAGRFSDGDTVFVVVERAEPAWRLVELAAAPPPSTPGRAVLRATWRRGRPQLQSAGRLYLAADKARAAEAAMAELRVQGEAARGAGDAAAAHVSVQPTPVPAQPPAAYVDLRVDDSGNLRLLRLRVGQRTFGE